MNISGWATENDTAQLIKKHSLPYWAVHNVFGLSLSSLGVGTYMGDANDSTDAIQEQAIFHLLGMGCNVLDCAPNYRNGRAERCVGKALTRAIEQGIIVREAVFLATKAGLVPENEQVPAYFAVGYDHSCFDPDFLKQSITHSLERLHVETVDCVFLHNLELLRLADTSHFQRHFAHVAQAMEDMVQCGLMRDWGISSWNGFRVPPDHPEYLSLDELLAHDVPHLRYLQLPLGLWGSEAITGKWQDGENILDHAKGLAVFANSPLLQGEMVAVLSESPEKVEKAICFVRDLPHIAVTLLGIKQASHVEAWHRMQYEKNYLTKDILQEFDQKE